MSNLDPSDNDDDDDDDDDAGGEAPASSSGWRFAGRRNDERRER